MLFLVFLYINYQRFQHTLVGTEYTHMGNFTCNPYKEMLPRGYCSDVLHDKLIGQDKKLAFSVDGNLDSGARVLYRSLLEGPGVVEDKRRVVEIINKVKANCDTSVVNKIETLLLSMETSTQSIRDVLKCLNESKWFLCNFYHQTCLQNKLNQIIIPSPPCLDQVEDIKQKPHCKYSFGEFFVKMYQIHSLCPTYFAGSSMDFNSYPPADMASIHFCQREGTANAQTKTMQKIYIDNSDCIVDTGENYKGFFSMTSSGKTCQPWSINPYLNQLTYPSLRLNYCRNPQDYGDQPWCYTDYERSQWEYCTVQLCENRAKPRNVKLAYILPPVALAVVILVVAVSIVYKRCKQVEEVDITDIQPYSKTTIIEVAANLHVLDKAIEEEFSKHQTLNENLSEDQITNEKLSKDQTTNENLSKDQNTNVKLSKNHTTNKNLSKDQTTNENLSKDQNTNVKLSKNQTTNEKLSKNQTTNEKLSKNEIVESSYVINFYNFNNKDIAKANEGFS